MILKKASYKAIKYACLKFHYAKTVPVVDIGFSVFNNNNEWCGCIVFGGGANYKLGNAYNCVSGQFLELTRMALNGKQESTSKVLSLSIKMIKKYKPLVKLLISYADKGQSHKGIIYQATNWFFVAENDSSGWEVYFENKWWHDRSIMNRMTNEEKKNVIKRRKSGKYKYLYPLTKDMRVLCNNIKKEYVK
jgi:hypothetical protein